MISKEQILHIAKLAKLELNSEEIAKLAKDLGSVLDYVEKLKEVEVEGVEPMSHSVDIANQVREDIFDNGSKQEQIISQFPEKSGRLNKVKAVFKYADK
jgi:aspartyl-tRNA(Asn)/glutamyl-tRNA(Gln) amidotransferase subunit C